MTKITEDRLASQPTARFEVQGHDSRDDEATNVALSQERAAAVVQYLRTSPVPPHQGRGSRSGRPQGLPIEPAHLR